MAKIQNDWLDYIGEEFQKDYYINLRQFLIKEYQSQRIYPRADDIFNAFHYTTYENTKVVILGQDPYHGRNQAHGLAFSVQKGIKIPPSLLNIYKEISREFGYPIANNGYLKPWADQGVLLLNTCLTVREGQAGSHQGMGWEILTDQVISALDKKKNPLVFLLWGNHAKQKKALIKNPNHYILESVHPSPLSANRGFFGNNHFKKCNHILKNSGQEEINWKIENIQVN